jgi:CHAT domain-containing protein
MMGTATKRPRICAGPRTCSTSARRIRIRWSTPFLLFTAFLMGAQPASSQSVQDQINQQLQKLAQIRSQKPSNTQDEATALTTLGGLYRQVGQLQKALDCYNQTLQLVQNSPDPASQARALDNIGRVLTDLGQEQKALDLFNQALPLWRKASNRRGEALTLNNIGRVYENMGQNQKALEFFNQSMLIWGEVGGHSDGEASTLNNIGRAYSNMSQETQALDYYNQALPVWRQTGNKSGEAQTLNNIGKSYMGLGQLQKTLDYDSQALTIWRAIGNREGEASTLNALGRIYFDFGQKQKSLDFYNQALAAWREVGYKSGEARCLNDMGVTYAALGDEPKALDSFQKALPITREAADRPGEALTLNYIGTAYTVMGQQQKAVDYYVQALPVWQEVKNQHGEAFDLFCLGKAYLDLGQPEKAVPENLAALSVAKAAGDPDLQGGIDTALMYDFAKQNQLEEAILFGTDAINSFQEIRKNIAGVDEELQAGYTNTRSGAYRKLAELLVQTDRLSEAERVLDMLKEEELKEVVRGAADDAAAKTAPLKLTDTQQKAESDLATPEKTAESLTALNIEYASLVAKDKRTVDEDARLKTLDKSIEDANSQVSTFFAKTLYPELAQKSGAQDANAMLSRERSDVTQLQNTLADLGPRVIGIRLLFGEDHIYAIVVTAHTREKFELKVKPADLRVKVLHVRDDLRSPYSDPKAQLQELYGIVVGPFESELKALEQSSPDKDHVPTLLWSLDGVLRYLPMAALYDGRQYMLERFNNVLFTPESYGHMGSAASAAKLRVLAMGLSKSYGDLPALPGVIPELEAVVHDPSVPDSHGPMDGRMLPNDQFTFAALKEQLGTGKTYPVVHIASHFVEDDDSGEEPFLMTGGDDAGSDKGYELTLSRMEDSPISFHGTQLLTLSACSTAKGNATQDGREVDSLGMIAQQKDAGAVLATLWDVNDASTSKLMSDFYSRWVAHAADGKAESLRQAQLALLRGPSPQQATYSHPFYWAPFVLIGNYQ